MIVQNYKKFNDNDTFFDSDLKQSQIGLSRAANVNSARKRAFRNFKQLFGIMYDFFPYLLKKI